MIEVRMKTPWYCNMFNKRVPNNGENCSSCYQAETTYRQCRSRYIRYNLYDLRHEEKHECLILSKCTNGMNEYRKIFQSFLNILNVLRRWLKHFAPPFQKTDHTVVTPLIVLIKKSHRLVYASFGLNRNRM